MKNDQGVRERLLQQIAERLDADLVRDGWATRYFEAASLDSLQERDAGALADILSRHLQLAHRRGAGVPVVAVNRPARRGGLASLQVCVDDMSFLVDTLVIAVRDAGAAVDWTIHPILRVNRQQDGTLIAPGEGADAVTEAWIHLEFDPLPGDDAYAALERSVVEHLADARVVAEDFEAMRARLHMAIESLGRAPAPNDGARLERLEAAEFLRWLDEGHFTFLATAETRFRYDPSGHAQSVPEVGAALGLARPGLRCADIDAVVAPRQELDKYAESPRVVVLTKAAQRSTVHHPEYMDHVAVRYFGADGRVAGIIRVIGLFSSDAYVERPWDIPLIRRRVQEVMERSKLRAGSHSAKNLREILHSLPRDELFQYGEQELFETCMGILALRDRHPLRLFLRRDRYGRFFSALVYLPRERFSRELRDRVAQELLVLCQGQSVERNIDFLRGGLTRVHAVVHTPPGTELKTPVERIEERLRHISRPWREQLVDALRQRDCADFADLGLRFGTAFATSYTERVGAEEAAGDVQFLARLEQSTPLLPRLEPRAQGCSRLKLYAAGAPRALAEILPVLDNFGVRAIRQDPELVRPAGGGPQWIQDFEVELPEGAANGQHEEFEAALLSVLDGRAEDDALNRLVLGAGLDSREVACVRMLARYVNQIGLPYGRAEIEQQVALHPQVARATCEAFVARFDPDVAKGRRDALEAEAGAALDAAVDAVEGLDSDRILRALASVVRAGLRTNFFQRDGEGAPPPVISLKLDPSGVPELPRPRPAYEIWVHSPQVEGVHLRGGQVARGGLRWSDRREDFRTEVLGLMKAQQVKNAVIVPVGAKGGFVVKGGPPASEREAWFENGRNCYRQFLAGLLDITDNREGDRVVPPQRVIRHDGDDPYLVVAADKGTATFSDLANSVAESYGFWLGDAFASGGSAGYDHKKMGITARGAWESVKRHFRERGLDTQSQPFTVVGIGDMSGDVFGNGMLLSEHIRLVAAFDHRHVFIDPDPDAPRSFAERQRLFTLPRSSWADYDRNLISEGGGIYPRTQKSIPLSAAARRALGTERDEVSPVELIRCVLKAPVDLLWNGGVGTYVKASFQSNEQAHDRSNDAVRVNGREVRARVIGEGGNLGFTQAGRIEYARHGAGGGGGGINTDAIDNSGGVHSSDREVNIKIPLNQLLRDGQLQRDDRDALLASMTPELVDAVLRDNEVQSGCVSLVESEAVARLGQHAALIRRFERQGMLDRVLEGLPDEEEIQERRNEGQGLRRPEIAVLVAYAKNALFEAAVGAGFADDPFFGADLLHYFPKEMVARFQPQIEQHRLRREIIATIWANRLVNRMGPAFAHQLAEDLGVKVAQVMRAYVIADAVLDARRYWAGIEALDHQIDAGQQYRLMHQAAALLRHLVATLAASRVLEEGSLGDLVQRYRQPLARIEELLPSVLPESYRADYDRHLAALGELGLSSSLAGLLTRARAMGSALDLADLAQEARLDLAQVAPVYFQVGEVLRLPWILSAIIALKPTNAWQALARTRLREDAYRLHRQIAGRVLAHGKVPPGQRLEAWMEPRGQRLRLGLARLQELQAAGAADFAGLAVAVRELHDLQAL